MRVHRELRCPSCGGLSRLGTRACAACGQPLESERDAVEVESILSDIEELMELIGESGAAPRADEAAGRAEPPEAPEGGFQRAARVEEFYRCAICGARVAEGDATCRICGTALDADHGRGLSIQRVGPPMGEIAPGDVELAQRPGPSEEVRVGGLREPAGPPAGQEAAARAGDLFAKRAVLKKRVVRRVVRRG